jgi:hypothetical protein
MSQPLAIIFLTATFASMMSVGSTGDIIQSFEITSFKFTTKREHWHDSAQDRGFSQQQPCAANRLPSHAHNYRRLSDSIRGGQALALPILKDIISDLHCRKTGWTTTRLGWEVG